MSKLADDTYNFLRVVFPHNIIEKERYINYKGQKLFFDFYIKDLSILIEVQGRQHEEFVKHFHIDKEGFVSSKRRDNLKKEYCQKKDIVLIEIKNEKELDKDKLLDRIMKEVVGV